jgi:hypothetical protein
MTNVDDHADEAARARRSGMERQEQSRARLRVSVRPELVPSLPWSAARGRRHVARARRSRATRTPPARGAIFFDAIVDGDDLGDHGVLAVRFSSDGAG